MWNRRAGIAIVLAELLLVGCAQASVENGLRGPFSQEFDAAMAETDSDFVSEILRDGTITLAEFSESQERYVACLSDKGIEAAVVGGANDVPSVEMAGVDIDSLTREIYACQSDWVGRIDELYRTMQVNPENRDWHSLVAECLVREGLAPPGFSGEDYRELESRAVRSERYSSDGDAPVEIVEPEDPDPLLPSGIRLYSDETEACRNSPSESD
jgi:hypothetical protein